MSTLYNVLVELLVAMLAVAIPIITKYATATLTALAEKLKAEHKVSETELEAQITTIRNKYLNYLESLVISSVNMVSQTYVDRLKDQGKFDKTAQQEAFNKAVCNVKSMLDNEVKAKLSELLGDVDTVIATLIEQTVLFNNSVASKTIKYESRTAELISNDDGKTCSTPPVVEKSLANEDKEIQTKVDLIDRNNPDKFAWYASEGIDPESMKTSFTPYRDDQL